MTKPMMEKATLPVRPTICSMSGSKYLLAVCREEGPRSQTGPTRPVSPALSPDLGAALAGCCEGCRRACWPILPGSACFNKGTHAASAVAPTIALHSSGQPPGSRRRGRRASNTWWSHVQTGRDSALRRSEASSGSHGKLPRCSGGAPGGLGAAGAFRWSREAEAAGSSHRAGGTSPAAEAPGRRASSAGRLCRGKARTRQSRRGGVQICATCWPGGWRWPSGDR